MKAMWGLLACLTISSGLAAQVPLERATPATNVIDFGSARLDPVQSIILEPGVWATSVSVTYVNQFNLTWHTRRVHSDRGLERTPLTADELRFIEHAFANDDVFILDLEGWRSDVVVSRGLANGMTVTAEIPYIDIGGGPNLDSMAEEIHSVFTTKAFGRDAFPRGENVVYLHSDEGTYQALDASGSGLGDVTVSITVPFEKGGFEQSAVFSAQMPTGDSGTLRGSGGWDAGLRWFGKWRGERRSWLVGAGASWLDDSGSFVGFERNWTWNVIGEMVQKVKGGFWVRFGLRVDNSPISDAFDESMLEQTTAFYRLGVGYSMPDESFVYFDLGEQIAPQTGAEADWSLHFGWSTKAGR